jgi:hypothetical protein
VLRGEKQIEIPSIYIMNRWEKRCKRWVYDCLFWCMAVLSSMWAIIDFKPLISQRSVLWWWRQPLGWKG